MRWLISGLVLAALFAVTASAAAASNADDYKAALAAFSQLGKKMAAQKRIPTLQDPDAAPLLKTLTDAHRFLDSQTYDLTNFAKLAELCRLAGDARADYMFFDPTKKPGSGDNPSFLPLTNNDLPSDQIASNIRAFQDETIGLQAFDLRCDAKLAPIAAKYFDSQKPDARTQSFIDGARHLRGSFDATFRGAAAQMLTIAGGFDLKESNAAILASALSDTAPTYAEAFSQGERQAIVQLVASTPGLAQTRYKATFDTITKAMARTDCGTFCKL